jgi:hypothetical protein
MIDKVLGDNIDYAKMLVNKTPAALASAADLNYGTANSFVDQLNPYAEVRTKDYDTVQSWLTTSDPIFQDARFAKAELEAQIAGVRIRPHRVKHEKVTSTSRTKCAHCIGLFSRNSYMTYTSMLMAAALARATSSPPTSLVTPGSRSGESNGRRIKCNKAVPTSRIKSKTYTGQFSCGFSTV